jgi:hypothetical protein
LPNDRAGIADPVRLSPTRAWVGDLRELGALEEKALVADCVTDDVRTVSSDDLALIVRGGTSSVCLSRKVNHPEGQADLG